LLRAGEYTISAAVAWISGLKALRMPSSATGKGDEPGGAKMAADRVFQLPVKVFHQPVGGLVETGSPGAVESGVSAQRLEDVGLNFDRYLRQLKHSTSMWQG